VKMLLNQLVTLSVFSLVLISSLQARLQHILEQETHRFFFTLDQIRPLTAMDVGGLTLEDPTASHP
jgi:hypothetical protein